MTEESDMGSYAEIIDGKFNLYVDKLLRDKTLLAIINEYKDTREVVLDVAAFIIAISGTQTAVDTTNKMVEKMTESSEMLKDLVGSEERIADKAIQASKDSEWLLDSCRFLANSMGNSVSKKEIMSITVLRAMMKMNDVIISLWKIDGLIARLIDIETEEGEMGE